MGFAPYVCITRIILIRWKLIDKYLVLITGWAILKVDCLVGTPIGDKLFDPFFKNNVLFHKFFHADSGQGLGVSHQTGWTGLVAWMIFQSGSTARLPRTPKRPRSSADHYFAESAPLTTAESVSSTDNGGHYGTVNSGFEGFQPPSVSELSPDEL
ncbi:hypothetical protein BY996DRAFT_6422336 [Phakopsora pachyrhizi]|nr:hypothetical protein BY996DRAFT_6422336 [Phakopsora pachyrhizi]